MKSVRIDGREVTPAKIVCVGRNYAEHIEELKRKMPDQPVIFVKQNSSISSEVRFHPQDEIHYEGEISFLVRGGEIAAVGFGLDLTKREMQMQIQENGLPWERAKSFDGSAIFSDFVSFDGDLKSLQMEVSINGELKQRGNYELMLNKPEFLIKEIAGFMSWQDNDLMMTGTPKGVAPIRVGDKINGRILQNGKVLVEGEWVVK